MPQRSFSRLPHRSRPERLRYRRACPAFQLGFDTYTFALADTFIPWKNTSIFPAYFASTPISTHTLPSEGATTSCFKVPLISFDA